MSEQPPPAPTSGPPPTTLPMGYQPPPPPTALPMGYQPPPGPAGPHEPPVDPPIEAYRPIAYQLPPTRKAHRGRTALLALFALVFVAGAVGVILVTAADGDPPPASGPAAAAAAPAPPVTATLDLTWPEIRAEPESAEPELRSSQTGGPTVVHFENLSGETVTVSWLDYGNTPVRYSDLPDRQGYDQDTYSGHVWVVTRADGSTQMYTASSSPARVVIR
ncbi:hypothetical protein [Actinoplanes sp. NPDC026670]|uniref:VHL beta domain-containing protein n=1 Tax=Actinoplanes sp. NPDC026670 TaxID=3154700 RepID=UPI0033CC576E